MTTRTRTAQWPAPVSIPDADVLRGTPTIATTMLSSTVAAESGLARVTPGVFVADNTGRIEVLHVTCGRGQLVHEDGLVSSLAPGDAIVLGDGWKGSWVVLEPIEYAYTLLWTEPW